MKLIHEYSVSGADGGRRGARAAHGREKSFNLKLSSTEVYYTIFLILLVKNMLCSKLHCQNVFELKLFSYKI